MRVHQEEVEIEIERVEEEEGRGRESGVLLKDEDPDQDLGPEEEIEMTEQRTVGHNIKMTSDEICFDRSSEVYCCCDFKREKKMILYSLISVIDRKRREEEL